MSQTGEIPSASPWPVRAAAAGIAAAAAAAYANTFGNGFVFLDVADIRENPTIRRLGDLGTVLSPPSAGGLTVGGRPMVNLSLAVNYALGGVNPWGYHVLNLLIHIAAGLVLFGIMRRTFSKGAWAVALLWTLHPLQTESVSYVIQRAESLMGLFYLLTLYCFIRYSEPAVARKVERLVPEALGRPWGCSSASGTTRSTLRGAGSIRGLWAVLCVVACLCGMATKEVMASAPVMVLLYDRTFLSGSFREAWRRRWPVYLALAATWAVVLALVLASGERGGTAGFGVGISLADYLPTQFPAMLHYLRLAVWPHPLVFDYGANWVADRSAAVLAAVPVLSLAGVCAWLLFRPKGSAAGRAIGFAGAWFFAILAPTSLVPGGSQTMAEHRMYLALIPVIAVIVFGVAEVAAKLEERRRTPYLPMSILTLAALALGWTTHERNFDYRDNLTIWRDTAAKWPGQARPHFNLGMALDDAGRPQEAAAELEQALRLNPNYPEALDGLGVVLAKSGRTAEAIARYREAMRMKPSMPEVHFNLGTALAQTGEYAAAVQQFEEAIRLKPAYPEAEDNFGATLAKVGRLPDAIGHYARAVRLMPDDAKYLYDLGTAQSGAGQIDEAVASFTRALRLKPDYASAETNLGATLAGAGRLSEAVPHFQRAVDLDPLSVTGHYNLAGALFSEGRAAAAIAQYQETLRLRPDFSHAHYNLAQVLRAAGRESEAEAELRLAARESGQ